MRKIIITGDSYLTKPCERCGSKKRKTKTWKETVLIFMGTTVIEHSQIVCTNEVCQADFDTKLLEETKKREVVRLKREENEALRKVNFLLQTNKTPKNKSSFH